MSPLVWLSVHDATQQVAYVRVPGQSSQVGFVPDPVRSGANKIKREGRRTHFAAVWRIVYLDFGHMGRTIVAVSVKPFGRMN